MTQQKLQTSRFRHLLLAVVFVTSTIVSSFYVSQTVSAAAVTWTGDGDGTSFNDGDNWSTDSAPVDGDSLVFDHSAVADDVVDGIVELNNNIVDLSVVGISFIGTPAEFSRFNLTGNALTVEGAITNTSSFGEYKMYNSLDLDILLSGDIVVTDVTFSSDNTLTTAGYNIEFGGTNVCGTTMGASLSGAGDIVFTGLAAELTADNTGYTGEITISDGVVIVTPSSLGSSSVGTVVQGGGSLSIYAPSDVSIAEPFTFGGDGFLSSQPHSSLSCAGAISPATVTTLTGGVTLTSDFELNSVNDVVIEGDYNPGSYTFSVAGGSTGTLTTPEGTAEVPEETIDAEDDQPSEDESVGNKQTLNLTGSRGNVTIGDNGILTGDGTAESVYVSDKGLIAPGAPIGTLTVTGDLTINGTYRAELLNAQSYDSIEAGSVTLGSGAQLNVVLYDGYDIEEGDTYTILNNTGDAAISGTFEGLDEGAEFAVGGISFSITYLGGAGGNDIVLTALTSGADVEAPNTGLRLISTASPLIVLIFGLASVAAIAMLTLHRSGSKR